MCKKILNECLVILLLVVLHVSPVYTQTAPVIERCNELLKQNKALIGTDLEMITRGDAFWYGLDAGRPECYYAVRDYLEKGEYASCLANDFDRDDRDEVALACKNRTDYYVVIFRVVRNKWYQYFCKIKVRGMFYLSNHRRNHDIRVCYFPDTNDYDVITWDGKGYTIIRAPQAK